MDGNRKKIIVVLGLVVLVLVGWGIKISFFDKAALITVVGEGRIKVQPEMVKFTMTVLNTSPTSTQAIADSNRLVRDLVSVMKNNGVEEKDISLSYVRIVPPQAALGQSSFQAVNSANVTLRNIGFFDNLVVQLYANGARSLTNILFTTENSRDLEKEAVAEAIKDAKARAKELAKASRKRLGRMVSVATVEVGEAGALAGETGQAAVTTGVISASPSQIEIIRQASIVFELK